MSRVFETVARAFITIEIRCFDATEHALLLLLLLLLSN